MKPLTEYLGAALTTKQVAAYLGFDEKTVRLYYKDLGGIRIGRHYRFFEMEVLNAIQTWNKIHRTDKETRKEKRKGFQDQKRGSGLGSRDEKNARGGLERKDEHSLLV